jgi:cell wall-associated NlpC family hydrolase
LYCSSKYCVDSCRFLVKDGQITFDDKDEDDKDKISKQYGSDVAEYVRMQIGKGYSQLKRFGPNTFDSSGLVVAGWKHFGVNVPSSSIFYPGQLRDVTGSELREGDIVSNTIDPIV